MRSKSVDRSVADHEVESEQLPKVSADELTREVYLRACEAYDHFYLDPHAARRKRLTAVIGYVKPILRALLIAMAIGLGLIGGAYWASRNGSQPPSRLVELSTTSVSLPLTISDLHRKLPNLTLRPVSFASAPAKETVSRPSSDSREDLTSARVPQFGPAFAGPQPVWRVKPDLPARSAGSVTDILVRIQVNVDRDGRVTASRVLSGPDTAYQPWIDAAVAAAGKWRFQPATVSGKSIASQYVIVFHFNGHE